MHRMTLLALPVLMSAFLSGGASGEEWGSLKGRLVFDGPVPTAAKIDVNKDQQFCGKFGLVDESLVVNPKNNGLANGVIWLYVARGGEKPAIHESYAKSFAEPVVADNSKCRFEPHVVTLRAGQKLVIKNSDQVGHNTKVDTFTNDPFNFTIPVGGEIDHTFDAGERLPVQMSCSIHPWMKSWLVLQEHPYVAVTDEDGNFEIKNIPAGNWTFQFWQEKSGYLKETSLGSGATDNRGRAELTIKPGELDLGTIKVSAELFSK